MDKEKKIFQDDTLSEDGLDFINYAWGPLLLHFKYPKKDLVKLKRICKKAKAHEDWSKELAGVFGNGNQDLVPIKDRLWFYESIESYFRTWCEVGVNFYGWHEAPTLKPQNFWVNHMEAGDFNPPHIHTGDITFVLFVDVPKAISEENKKYNGSSLGPGALSLSWGTGGEIASKRDVINSVNIMPTNGDLIIFPTRLAHWVFPFSSKVTRISVSGNFTYSEYPAYDKEFNKDSATVTRD